MGSLDYLAAKRLSEADVPLPSISKVILTS